MRRYRQGAAALLAAILVLLGAPALAVAQDPAADERPLAFVYRGPASVPGTAETVAEVLSESPSNFRIEYVGPDDAPITAEILDRASVFAQPGGPSLRTAWRAMEQSSELIRDWVAAGGNYLGFCVGGYLAGATPGYDLLPGDTSQYSAKPGATVKDTEPSRSTIMWRGTAYTTYFQDPPAFELEPDHNATILATYQGGEVAALATDYGRGRVGVVGPHIEADASWFIDDGLSADDAVHRQLAFDFIETTVGGNKSGTHGGPDPILPDELPEVLPEPSPSPEPPVAEPTPVAPAPVAPEPSRSPVKPDPGPAEPDSWTRDPVPTTAPTPEVNPGRDLRDLEALVECSIRRLVESIGRPASEEATSCLREWPLAAIS